MHPHDERYKLRAFSDKEMGKKPKKGKHETAPPWANAHPRVTVNFSTKFAEELHMQMTWLTENVPKTSIQRIVQDATKEYVAKQIKEHYKPCTIGEA